MQRLRARFPALIALVLSVAAAGATLALLATLVTLAERRYRRIRREILVRENEDTLAHRERRSPIAASLQTRRPAGTGAACSGHRLLSDGPEALAARLASVDAAARTLDLQYYSWHDDLAGRVLARQVLAAAARGVRCRVLLDDLHARGTRKLLETLAAHPNVTVRVFNPSLTRRAYFLHWLFDFRRLNRRMHNKALVADGVVAIVGGRNVGDIYFGLSPEMNFRDCDVLVAGPAARSLADSVTRYWNSDFAFPSAAFGIRERVDETRLRARLAALDDSIVQRTGTAESTPSADAGRGVTSGSGANGTDGARAAASRRQARASVRAGRRPALERFLDDLLWCPSHLLDDPPDAPSVGASDVARALGLAIDGTHDSLEIEAGYLVPGRDGVRRVAALRARGVAVRVLTNSFATTDVLAAQSGYATYRADLLRCGVELHELKPDAPVRRVRSLLRGSIVGRRPAARTVAGLHTKVLLVDRRLSFVGSFNLDPRSARDNSELMLLIDGEAFAERVATFLADGRAPASSYRVSLGPRGVLWRDDDRVRRREPGLTRPARLFAALVRALPVERLL